MIQGLVSGAMSAAQKFVQARLGGKSGRFVPLKLRQKFCNCPVKIPIIRRRWGKLVKCECRHWRRQGCYWADRWKLPEEGFDGEGDWVAGWVLCTLVRSLQEPSCAVGWRSNQAEGKDEPWRTWCHPTSKHCSGVRSPGQTPVQFFSLITEANISHFAVLSYWKLSKQDWKSVQRCASYASFREAITQQNVCFFINAINGLWPPRPLFLYKFGRFFSSNKWRFHYKIFSKCSLPWKSLSFCKS